MVLPTKKLASTLHPFTVLVPEEDGGLQAFGRRRRGEGEGISSGENGNFDVKNNQYHNHNQNRCNTIHVSRLNRSSGKQQRGTGHGNENINRSSCTLSRIEKLSPPPQPPPRPPPMIPIIKPGDIASAANKNSDEIADTDGIGPTPPQKRQRICGTTTLAEEHRNEKEIEKRRIEVLEEQKATELNPNEDNDCNNNSDNSAPQVYDGSNNKILNLLNAKNSSFLSNCSSSNSSCNTNNKFSEDELFLDLKSRFLEKHFRTILRSQESKESRIFGGGGTLTAADKEKRAQQSPEANINKSGKDGANKDFPNKSSSGNACSTLLKSLRFVTVERPEPQLDLPRISYFKSTKQKFLKMQDQAKLRVVERYRKLCASLRTTLWPQLYPVQVLVEILLSNVFMLFVAPFVMCAVMLLCVVRFCIGAILKIRYKGRYHLMRGSDAAWAHQSFANDNSFLSLYVIQGDCSISRIRERIMKSVINCQDPQYPEKLTYSRLKCRITEKFGFYCWETLHPMDFCIDDHVRYITNDPSAVLTQEQVLREIQRFIDQPLPEDQPQWQILVVPKFLYNRDYYPVNDDLDDDGFGNFDTITVKKKPAKNNNNFYTGNHYYALVWRINHALMDGISAASCLQHCIADMPVKLTIDPLQSLKVPIGMQLLMYLKMAVFGPRSLLRSMLHRDLNCFHGPGLTGPKTLAWSRGINLQTVKTIRKRNESTTTTAVLASAVGGSLRGLALRKNNPVPKEIRAGVTCALLPYPNIKPQNRFTVAHLKLRLDAESNKERLLSATNAAKELVRSADIIKNFELIRMVGLVPKKAIPWFMDNCEATVLISNIPGPMEEYTIFQGQKLVDIIGWNTIKGNTAIGVCLFSYAGRIRAGVIADSSVLPSSTDVPALIEEFEKDIVNFAKEADMKEKDVFMDAL